MDKFARDEKNFKKIETSAKVQITEEKTKENQMQDHMQFGPQISNMSSDITLEAFWMLHLFIVRRILKSRKRKKKLTSMRVVGFAATKNSLLLP